MQTIPLEEYRKRIRLQGAREEGIEEGLKKGLEKTARLMLADGKPLQEIAKYTGLPTERLQQLQPH